MIHFCLLLLLSSCAAPYYFVTADRLQEGRFEEAAKPLAKADLPYTQSKEAPLLLLLRAMVYFHCGKYLQGTADFEKALDAMDYYRQTSIYEVAQQILIQDSSGAYFPPPFEWSLARFYQALALLHLGDEGNAAATVYYQETHSSPSEQNPLTTFLLATLFQRRGDFSNAKILFDRLGLPEVSPSLLVIHHRGRVPLKASQIAPFSIVSAALLEALLNIQNVRPALSTLAGVPVPVLHRSYTPTRMPLSVNGHNFVPTLSYDVTAIARDTLEKEAPQIAAHAAARLLIRRGLVGATKENYQPLMDMAMLISNIVTEANTRSWTTLPSCIDLYALDLPVGEHCLQIGKCKTSVKISTQKLAIVEISQPTSENIYLKTQEDP